MALVSCPECKKEVSKQAESCPNCGYDLKTKRKWYDKTRFVVLWIFLFWPVGLYGLFKNGKAKKGVKIVVGSIVGIFWLLIIIGVFSSESTGNHQNPEESVLIDEKGNDNTAAGQIENQETPVTVSDEVRASIINEYKNGVLFPEIVESYDIGEDGVLKILNEFVGDSYISRGMYKVGSEIEPGLYFIDGECYWQISSDSSGDFDSIISNDNNPSFGYVELREGDYFSFNSGRIILRQYIDVTTDTDNLQKGTYWVGNDIPSGEYKITGEGYWERTSNARGGFESILANDNYEGSVYVTVNEGDFFKFDGVGVAVQ